MTFRHIEAARQIGRNHGAEDMDHIAMLPLGIERLRVAYATLGRARLVYGLDLAAGRRATGALGDRDDLHVAS